MSALTDSIFLQVTGQSHGLVGGVIVNLPLGKLAAGQSFMLVFPLDTIYNTEKTNKNEADLFFF